MIKVITISLVLLTLFSSAYSQSDSLDYIDYDSVYQEESPNYLGFNISPLVAGIVGDYNKDVKFSLVYKRNFGLKNFRVSANHHLTVNKLPYDSYKVIATTDTSFSARYFSSDLKSYDIRLGFEELRGYRHARLHIGADLILGYALQEHHYHENILYADSSGRYRVIDDQVLTEAVSKGEYFDLGLDVSFGFDWFLSDDFLFTFQMTPQFNYYIKMSGENNDQQDVLADPGSFFDFKLTYFDVMLIHKF